MFLIEVWALGEKKVAMLVLFILINEWCALTLLRTHFIIDMVTGLALATLVHRIAEHITFIYDVKICGFQTENRQPYYYKPCRRCGWSNEDASLKISQEELALQLMTLERKQVRLSLGSTEKTIETKSGDSNLEPYTKDLDD